jgi:hypothetical protein
MKIVKWSFHTGHDHYIDHPECVNGLIDNDYKPHVLLSADALQSRKDVTFIKCPAVTDFMKSTYVFRSPMDLNIEIEVSDQFSKVFCNNISQDFFDTMVDMRFLEPEERGNSPYPLIGIDFLNTFTCDSSVKMQVFPAFMHYNDFTSKTTVIPGEYDISKWVRPVELVFEIRNKKEYIEIKKGDALAYFKFNADEPVKLENDTTPWNEIVACNDLRNANKFRPLKERYKSYKDFKNDKS